MILNKLIELRSSLSPIEALDALLGVGGTMTTSGERVNPDKALGVSAYFAANRAISEDVGGLPLPIYRRLTRGKQKLVEHPVYPLLNRSANPYMSSMTWRTTTVHHAMGWGNGYSEIQVDVSGTPIALWPIDPCRVEPKWDDDGVLVYKVQQPTGRHVILPYWKMFHLHGLGFNGLTGYSIAEYAKQTLGLAIAQEKSGAALFGNSSRPAGVLRHPQAMEKTAGDKFREEWERMHGGGSENAHKTAILPYGMEWVPIAFPNKDTQWLESRGFSVIEIARWHRIPPHKLQDLTRGTYSNIDAQNIEYVVDALTSWMTYFEQEVDRKLLTSRTDKSVFAEHLAAGLLRGDIQTRYGAHAVARQWGWASANDVREKENENLLPGEQGDIYLVPMNMVPADQVGKTEPKPEPEPEPMIGNDGPSEASVRLAVMQQLHSVLAQLGASRDDTDAGQVVDTIGESYMPILADVYQRLSRLENDKLGRALRNAREGELDDFWDSHHTHVRDMLSPYVRTFGEMVWLAIHGTELPARMLDRLTGEVDIMAERSVKQSRAELVSLGKVKVDGRHKAELKRLCAAMKDICSQESTNG